MITCFLSHSIDLCIYRCVELKSDVMNSSKISFYGLLGMVFLLAKKVVLFSILVTCSAVHTIEKSIDMQIAQIEQSLDGDELVVNPKDE